MAVIPTVDDLCHRTSNQANTMTHLNYAYEKEMGENKKVQDHEWGRRDLNPHALRHMILSHACLPIPALPRGLEL